MVYWFENKSSVYRANVEAMNAPADIWDTVPFEVVFLKFVFMEEPLNFFFYPEGPLPMETKK
jgi:hypothetical protein